MEASSLPFAIPAEDITRLETSEEFQSIRRTVASQQGCPRFCQDHKFVSSADGDGWVLHRDIIHALILPVLQIYRQASRLADLLLRPNIAVDLELAFRGEARGTFTWLQCLLSDEVDLCCTKSCPACIVTHVLHSEPTIRLVLVAFRIPEYGNGADYFRPNLPSFAFWLNSLRTALDTNPFWGSGYWTEVEGKAVSLEKGMRDLIQQCSVLEGFVACDNDEVGLGHLSDHSRRTPLLKRSKTTDVCHLALARRQLTLVTEEQAWMRRMILNCWKASLAEATRERRDHSSIRPLVTHVRARSSTS